MTIFDMDQYSPEWWKERRGVPTASEFGSIMTAKTMKLAAAHETYIHRLIGDLFDLEYGKKDDIATAAMRRGTEMEPEAREFYEVQNKADVRQVGFCLDTTGRFGCSPDGLVGEDGCLELKNPSAHTHVAWTLAGGLPDEHRAQVHGHLIVTGRKWCDFLSYYPGLPPLVVRTEPDEYTAKLAAALDEFWTKYQTALALFKPPAAKELAA